MNTQYFLPMQTPDRRVLGMVSITGTLFVGNETSVDVSGTVYPLIREQHVSPRNLQPIDYMAIPVTFSEERGLYQDHPYMLMAVASTARWWGGFVRTELVGDLTFFLEGGLKGAYTAPSTPAPQSGSNITNQTFYANAPFANSPQAMFFDIPWIRLAGIADPTRIFTVSIGTISADPSGGNNNGLKAMIAYAPNVVNPAGSNSMVRVVRMSKTGVVPGTYTWPLTFTDIDQGSTTINVSVIVA